MLNLRDLAARNVLLDKDNVCKVSLCTFYFDIIDKVEFLSDLLSHAPNLVAKIFLVLELTDRTN
jgi:hypothetical protein